MATTRRLAAPLTAYVLHRYDWSETSLILDLFTREQGRLAVAAKGAKRPYSQLRSVLLPFQKIHVGLGRVPKSENADESTRDVQNLRSAEWAGGAAMLTGAALFSGFYLNELLMKLLARHDPHPVLFDVYAGTLPLLAHGDDAVSQAALRAFEIALLKRKLSGSRKPGARVRIKGGIAQDEHLWIVLCLQSWFDQNQAAFIFLQVQRVNKWVYTYTRVPNDPGDRNFFEHAVMFENHGSWCYTFHYSRGVDFHSGFVQCLLDEFPNLVAHTWNHPVAHFYYHYARLTL